MRISELVAERTRRRMEYLKLHEQELEPRTITVLLDKGDDFLSKAERPGSELVWYSDESRERGGEGKGPSPLAYLLSAMGFCQFVHYTERCAEQGIRLDSLKMKVDGKVSLQSPRRFTSVQYMLEISSNESDESIRNLAREAANDCYVTNTLKRACPVTGVVIHNGKEIDQHR